MAHSDVTVRARLGGRIDFPRLVAGTTLLVTATILLGIATKATGSGLACQARWPVCDGGFLDLFPRSFPSFFEWIHRVVAGVTGFAILGTAWAAWRGDVPRRIRQAVTLGLVLLPIQVLLGRETVLSFTTPILALHFWTAVAIFSSFVAATALTYRDRFTPERLRNLLVAAAVLVPVQVLLNPPLVTSFTPPVQTTQYLVTLVVFGAILSVALTGRAYLGDRATAGMVGVAIAEPLLVYAGRHMFGPPSAVLLAYVAVAAVTVLGLLWLATVYHRTDRSTAA